MPQRESREIGIKAFLGPTNMAVIIELLILITKISQCVVFAEPFRNMDFETDFETGS